MTTINHGESLASVRAKINDALVVVSNLLGFSRVFVVGQSDVIATDSGSTLTLEAGSNISLTTNGSTNTVTISSTGGGGGEMTSGAGIIIVGSEVRLSIGTLPLAG